MESLTEQVESGSVLSGAQVREAAAALLDGAGDTGAKVRFLGALSARGETPEEIAMFVDAFLGHAVDPGLDPASCDFPLLDVCGTGGDRLGLFNVSTTSMFVVAAGGVGVVKHGNRGITSQSGGADVLEALGVPIDLAPEAFVECVRRHGIGFMLAPRYHPAFKAVVPVRQALAKEGKRTIFNLVGPLLNPVRPDYQLVGVFHPDLTSVFAQILGTLGRRRAWAVCGDAGEGRWMDEFSTVGPTTVARLDGGSHASAIIDPAMLGFGPPPPPEALAGGDAATNARILTSVLDGSERGPKRDLALLNAAAGLAVAGRVASLEDGLALARELVDSGAAMAKLEALRAG